MSKSEDDVSVGVGAAQGRLDHAVANAGSPTGLSGYTVSSLLSRLDGLRKRAFVRSIAVIASGTAVSQAISLVFSPILTRLYGPAAYGELNLFLSIVGVIGPISTLAYANAIVLPRSDMDGLRLVRMSITVSAIISTTVAAVFLLGTGWISDLLGSPSIERFYVLVPLAVFVSSVVVIFDQWFIRKKLFKNSTKIQIVQSIVDNCAKVGLGWVIPGSAVLVGISVASGAASGAQSFWASRKSRGTAAIECSPRPAILDARTRELAREYRSFPLFRAPEMLLNTLSQNFPILMLGALFGTSAAGLYSISNRVITLPFLVISMAVGKAFTQRVTEVLHSGADVRQHLLKTTMALAAIGAPFFLAVALLGPWLFGFVFGVQWTEAGEYARWLSLWSFGLFCNTPCISVLPLLGLLAHNFIFQIFVVSGRAVMLWVGFTLFDSATTSVALFSLFGLLVNVLLIGFVVRRAASVSTSLSVS